MQIYLYIQKFAQFFYDRMSSHLLKTAHRPNYAFFGTHE